MSASVHPSRHAPNMHQRPTMSTMHEFCRLVSPGQAADIELAVESCLAVAVRQRVMDTLWQQHAAADRLLLATAAGLADGSGSFLPRSASMAADEQAVGSSWRCFV